MNFDNISPEIKVYLDEISKRLFTHHAAIMVGAGFSKNAEPNNESSRKNFADWNDLGNTFYEKLYGKDAKFPQKEFLNVLKLAEEVEATFGRPVLDNILQESIPDMEYEPSKLHAKLLNLPWVDIFTTNYDTLLERAAKSVFNRKYTIVLSKNDLVYASKPRIIKLHGSFPSHTPFIITEEDYRIYPKINAPFVNTVQQSLLENTLCLIGFSGNDPNFFQWLGWLRDNLEANISKIYLIGAFDLSATQKKLLEKRNIVLVNIADNHYDALNLFVEYLSYKARTNNILLWPYDEVYKTPDSKNNLEKTLVEIISVWKKERETYPKWVVLPEEKRTGFFRKTEKWIYFIQDSDDVKPDIKFKFVFELCWRLDKSLYPFDNIIAGLIKSVLGNDIDTKEKFSLSLWLLKFYRQSCLNENWNDLYARLEGIDFLTMNQKGELDYENGLHALFNLDYPKLRNITEKWQFPNNTPFENAKKAGILSEIGELSKAKEIIEKALIAIHEQQASTNSATECHLLSQESYILNLYQLLVKNHRDLEVKSSESRDYRDRIAILNLSSCNPIREQKHFADLLLARYKEESQTEINEKYDVGEIVITTHLVQSFKEQINAFAFLLYCENIGMPFCIHTQWVKYDFFSKEALASIIRIADFNLFWAISVCCRIADQKAAETLFTRSTINKFTVDYINNLCEALVSTLAENEKEIAMENQNEIQNFAQILAKILPEIISRLCTKCRFDIKSKVLQLINSILSSNSRGNYQKVGVLIKRFIKSLLPVEMEKFLIDIIKLEIPKNLSILEADIEPPLQYIENVDFVLDKNFSIDETILEPYYVAGISDIASVRQWGIITLVKLNELKLLNNDQKTNFAKVLWSKIDNRGLPINANCLGTYFITLPHPSDKKPVDIIKKSLDCFQLHNFKIGEGAFTQNVYSVENFFREINFLLIKNLLNKNEIKTYIDEIFAFWENNKDILNKLDNNMLDFQGLKQNVKYCFYAMRSTLASLFTALDESCDAVKIEKIVGELKVYELPILYLQYAAKFLSDVELKNKLELQIGDKDALKRIDALIVFEKFLNTETNDEKCYLFKALLFSILYGDNKLISYNIETVINLINNKIEFAERLKADMMNVLLHLGTITKYDNKDSKLSFEEKLAIRQKAMRLAFILHKNLANADEEKEIKYWKDCSEDENEFAEVRNKWG